MGYLNRSAVSGAAKVRVVAWAALLACGAGVGGCGEEHKLSSGRSPSASSPYQRRHGPMDKVEWLTAGQAYRRLEKDGDIFLLCVATKEQYDVGHIPGSVLIPVMGLRAGLVKNEYWPEINKGRVPRKDQPIICYCWWKQCICPSVPTYTHLAARVLVEQGYRNVAIIDGGMREWKKASLPIATSNGEPGIGADKPPGAEQSP